jgi:hypothetical protein
MAGSQRSSSACTPGSACRRTCPGSDRLHFVDDVFALWERLEPELCRSGLAPPFWGWPGAAARHSPGICSTSPNRRGTRMFISISPSRLILDKPD